MKLSGSKPEQAPPIDDAPPADTSFGGEPMPDEPSSDKPFDDEPFNAGVEADEQSDPKKFIEQLTGKLGQSLRKYTEEQGQPDFELEKFSINSLLSATHTSEMDAEDQDDIIKKVKEAGNDDNQDKPEDSNVNDSDPNEPINEPSGDMGDTGEGTPEATNPSIDENLLEKDENFLIKPKKLSIFAPEGSEEANFKHKIVEKLHETFNQEKETMSEPSIAPAPVKTPKTQPSIAPSRKNKPFLPMPSIQPDPKASK